MVDASLNLCSTKNGNKYQKITNYSYNGTNTENVLTSQNSILDSLLEIIRNTLNPDYNLPNILSTGSVTTQDETIVFDFTFYRPESFFPDEISFSITNNSLVFIDNAYTSNNPGAIDMSTTSVGNITIDYSKTNTGSTGTYTLNYTYNTLTSDLDLTLTTTLDPISANIVTNTVTLATRTPPTGSLPADVTAADSDFTYTITNNSVAYTNVVNSLFITSATGYSYKRDAETNSGNSVLNSTYTLNVSNNEVTNTTPPTGSLYLFYDPTGVQIPIPSSTVLSGYLADDPNYTDGGTGPNNLSYFEKISKYYFSTARKFSDFIFNTDSSTITCTDTNKPGGKFSASDPCGNQCLEMVVS